MKISILLPYKENYAEEYAGAVSIFVSDTVKHSTYSKQILVYGSTNYTNFLTKNYRNIILKKKFFTSNTKKYLDSFLDMHQKKGADLIEIHNRPNYVFYLNPFFKNLILYFHNDPNTMLGSKTVSEKIKLLNICKKIIFNSNWSKRQFLKGISYRYLTDNDKLIVIYQSVNKTKISYKNKKKIISFVGKLNYAKGFDLFCNSVIKILDKNPDWSANVIGDEPREKYNFKHERLNLLGFKNHKFVLDNFAKSSIAVVCSRWEEPFGRTSLEASSRGCAVIISNRGGLPETIKNGIILKNLSVKELYKELTKLVSNPKKLRLLQKQNYNNLTNDTISISKKIDNYRYQIHKKNDFTKKKILKILHVTNFNERHNGRLFYNTGRRINNGLIRSNHSVLEFSDRDILSYSRNLNDISGAKKLNEKLLNVIKYYNPDLIIFGHADLITNNTLQYIKNNYPNIKLCQWFLDRMDGEWLHNKKRFVNKIDYMDANFCTTDPSALNLRRKNNIYFLPNPVDASMERLNVYKNKNYEYDIFFAMSHGVHRGDLKKGKLDKRENFIKKLIKNNPNLRFNIFGMNNVQPIWSDQFLQELNKCKIGINLSQGASGNYYSSDRFSQIIGNGLLLFVDKKTKLGNFFNNEIITYKNLDDLSAKLNFFSKKDKLRSILAQRSKKKYFKNFNSSVIAQYIIDKSFKSKKNYFWEKFFTK